MTGEDMERAIEFLLNQQARQSANIDKLTEDVQSLKEAQAQVSTMIMAMAETQAQVSTMIMAMAETQAQTSRDVMTLAGVVSELSDTVARVETQMVEGFVRLDARMDRFEAQAEVDRREMREGFARADERMDRFEAQAEAERREMREGFARADERMDRFEAQAESDRQEIREAIGSLIKSCEDTKSLSEKVALLAAQTSRRVTDIESRLA